MVFTLAVLTGLALLSFVVGIALALRDRGKRQVRRGPDVYREIVDSAHERDATIESDVTVARRTWAWGDGLAVSGKAEYSWPELISGWREGRWRFLLPVLLGAGGMLGLPLFGGLTLVAQPGAEARVFGFGLVLFSCAMGFVVLRLIRRAVDEFDRSSR